MPTTSRTIEVRERMLTRQRDALAGRGDVQSSVVFGEALLVADLLVGAAANPDDLTNAEIAEILRTAALTLAATNHSYTAVHSGPVPLLDAELALDHAENMAECLVLMADDLDPSRTRPVRRGGVTASDPGANVAPQAAPTTEPTSAELGNVLTNVISIAERRRTASRPRRARHAANGD